MSGTTRQISIRLSAEGAEVVRRALQEVGESGQRALATLDTATQRAATQMTALRGSTDQASTGAGRLQQAVGSAGFQLQDFAVQVQSGTSALTALSQQGSQFLGVFGTGGAVAGAALTVGILAAQFLGLGQNAEDAGRATEEALRRQNQAAEDLAKTLEGINDLLLTQAQRASAARNAQVVTLRQGLDNSIFGANSRLDQTAIEEERLRTELRDARLAAARAADRARPFSGGAFDSLNDPLAAGEGDLLRGQAVGNAAIRDRQLAERRAEELERRLSEFQVTRNILTSQVRELGEQRDRLDRAGFATGEVFGPEAPERVRPERGGSLPRLPREGRDPMLAEAQRLFDTTRNSAEQYEATLVRLGELRPQLESLFGEAGADQVIERRAQQALETFERAGRVAEQVQRTDDVTRQLGLTFSSAFEDAVIKGKSFQDVLKGIEQDLLRLGTRKLVTEPLAALGSSALSSITGGAGLGGLASGLFGSIFGGGSVTPSLDQMATPGFFASFHTGGIVGDTPPAWAPVNPAIFAGAPRYHSGGIAGLKPDEVPAILQRGERVIPRGQARGGMGNVINMTVMAADAPSFRASQAQIMGELARAMARGQRNT